MIKKKSKIFLPIIAVIVALTVLVSARFTMAYLTDTETAENVITVGNVALQIDEGSFTNNSSSAVAAYQKIDKSPKIINTGTKDEFVFFQVAVPKARVTLLHETDTTINTTEYKTGTKVVYEGGTTTEKFELFKMIASTNNNLTVSPIPDNNTPKKVVFNYHSGNSTNTDKKVGWIYLNSKGPISNDSYNYYVFGYNKKLIAGSDTSTNQTVTLFDQIQLKSFIDEELGTSNNVTVEVKAYGIQSDELGYSADYLDDTALGEIWDILNRKQVTPSED